MTKTKTHSNGEQQPTAVYFKSLTIRDVKCFKGEHTIDLSDGAGRPAQWTVILGNNNTGKTTLLKCLASLEFYVGFEFGDKVSLWKLFTGQQKLNADVLMKPSGSDHLGDQSFEIRSQHFMTRFNLKDIKIEQFSVSDQIWVFNSKGTGTKHITDPGFANLIIETYGASRKMSDEKHNIPDSEPRHSSLFQNEDLINTEKWFLQLNLTKFQGSDDQKNKAQNITNKAVEIMTSGLLPDVKNLRFTTKENGQSFDNFIEFQTDFGWIRLKDLGYGYQTMLAWILDLVRRMFERYPESKNPIQEPAIVLVDEIDLHLHPEWQRKIISHLTKYFPNTQFIVTAHSPLVVQSAENINLVLLEKEGDHVNITQPEISSFQGWSLEEILSDLMGLGENTHSEKYLEI